MPVYEYRCRNGHLYEKTEGFSAPVVQRCPTCRASARRQISMPAVIFKGPGFYSTDNRKGGWGSDDGASPSGSTVSSDGHGHSHDHESAPEVEAAD